MRGPLGPYALRFCTVLISQEYAPSSVRQHMRLMACAGRWMTETGLQPFELTPEVVDRFLALRRTEGQKFGISAAAVAPLMSYLRRLGVAPEPLPSAPSVAGLDGLIEEYRTYLVKERGLTPGTIRNYIHVARLFLAEQSEVDRWNLKEPTAGHVFRMSWTEVRAVLVGPA